MAAPGKGSVVAAATTLGIAVIAACGSTTDGLGHGPADADGGSSSGSGTDDGAAGTFTAMTDAAFSLDAFGGCAATTQQATELPLDLYIMLDSSGSMSNLVGPQKSKWKAVVSAVTAFVSDPASAGIGVGLQYFPLTAAGVPKSCTASSQCPGSSGPCFFGACDPSRTTGVIPCDSNLSCPVTITCDTIGQCHNDPNVICPPGKGSLCGTDANGFDLGSCDTITTSTCVAGDSCVAQDYATPAVPIALLPGASAALSASLVAHSPSGNTPTSQALLGAITQAKTYALANPGHSVVALLATDGIPDECTPNDIPGIAQIAGTGLSGSPSVKTFAIGVFTPDAKANGTSALNQIAAAGGTKQAFIIDSSSPNVEQQFATALSAIRGAALPCQYEVPLPDSGTPDFGRVNVEYTSGAGVGSGLPYVGSAAKCGAASGWYYDADPAAGGVPSRILVCPATCSTLQNDAKGRVDVVVGCRTIAR